MTANGKKHDSMALDLATKIEDVVAWFEQTHDARVEAVTLYRNASNLPVVRVEVIGKKIW